MLVLQRALITEVGVDFYRLRSTGIVPDSVAMMASAASFHSNNCNRCPSMLPANSAGSLLQFGFEIVAFKSTVGTTTVGC